MSTKQQKRKDYIPFISKIRLSNAAVVLPLIIIVFSICLYIPHSTIKSSIDNTQNLIVGLYSGFHKDELEKISDFALTMINATEQSREKEEDLYASRSFAMLLQEQRLFSAEDILTKVESWQDFDYPKFVEWYYFWQREFEKRPGLLEIYINMSNDLTNAKNESKIPSAELYLFLDSGKKEGFFKSCLAFVVTSEAWFESASHAGEKYNLTNEQDNWRSLAINGQEGYDHNSIVYLLSTKIAFWIQSDADEWGEWFSSWKTFKVGNNWLILNIDFNATKIKKLIFWLWVTMIAIFLSGIFLIYFLTFILSREIIKPIDELTTGAHKVGTGDFYHQIPIISNDEFGQLSKTFNKMINGLKERDNLKDTLDRFLSRELAEKAAKEGINLGGQSVNCTIIFTDFAGFLSITKGVKAEKIVEALNTYFSELVPIVKQFGGFTDKYIGDAIVGIFGAPVQYENHAERALTCAIQMQRKMREINKIRKKENKIFFEMRIGLNSGNVVVGAIGCDEKLEYTSIGEVTNIANRMETGCEIGQIRISENTYQALSDKFQQTLDMDQPEAAKIKGLSNPVKVYNIYIDKISIAKKNLDDIDNIQKELYVYTSRTSNF